MEETFDPSKESRTVRTQWGRPNENQVTESEQIRQEQQAKREGGSDGSKKENNR